MWSATRTARTISFTSCTRTMSAPRSTAATTVAVVPSSRSVTGRSSSLPMKDLREVPTRIGCPSSLSSENRRKTSQFWSAVLPNPMPGSTITFSFGTPAAIARAAAAARNLLISSIRSPAYSAPSWLCITTRPHPCRPASSARAGERVRPHTSFRIVAPTATPTSATSCLYVSSDTGTPDSRASRRTTASVREISSAAEVTGIAYDSRRVAPGDLFVAVQGLHVDGHVYLTDAVAKGAVALAIERDVKVPAGIPVLHLPSTRTGLAELSAEFFGRPSRRLKLAGVTGTDGKTTVTHMAEHVLQASGIVAGAMSTVAFKVSGREVDNVSGQTTTEAPEVQGWLARMVEAGAACAVIETTSHALVQERVHACDFDVAAFTNVGHDHLDYHASWEEYIEAKARLIDLTSSAADKGVEKTAVLNRDDPS